MRFGTPLSIKVTHEQADFKCIPIASLNCSHSLSYNRPQTYLFADQKFLLSFEQLEAVCMQDVLWGMFVIYIFQKVCMNCLLQVCYINIVCMKIVVCN